MPSYFLRMDKIIIVDKGQIMNYMICIVNKDGRSMWNIIAIEGNVKLKKAETKADEG